MTKVTITPDSTLVTCYYNSSNDSTSKVVNPSFATVPVSDKSSLYSDDSQYLITFAYASIARRYGRAAQRFVVDLSAYNPTSIEIYWDGYMYNEADAGSSLAVYANGVWTDRIPLPTSDSPGFEYSETFPASALGSTIQFGIYGNVSYPEITGYLYLYSDTFRIVIDVGPPIVTKELNISFNLFSLFAKLIQMLYSIRGFVYKTIKFFTNVVASVRNIKISLYNSKTLIGRSFSNIWRLSKLLYQALITKYSLKHILTKSITIFYSMILKVIQKMASFHSLFLKISKLFVSNYLLKSLMHVLLTVFSNIKTMVHKFLKFIHHVLYRGFYIISVSVEPGIVHRNIIEATTLRCDWHDESDLDPDFYECEFWLRDEDNNIYGPFKGTVVKKASKEYYATFQFDPETEPLGWYDIKVVVTKYG